LPLGGSMSAVVVVGRSRDRVLSARACVSESAASSLRLLFTCAGKNLELNGASGLAPQLTTSNSGDEAPRARTNPRSAAATHDAAQRDTAQPTSQ
jgi:hypothetical protein